MAGSPERAASVSMRAKQQYLQCCSSHDARRAESRQPCCRTPPPTSLQNAWPQNLNHPVSWTNTVRTGKVLDSPPRIRDKMHKAPHICSTPMSLVLFQNNEGHGAVIRTRGSKHPQWPRVGGRSEQIHQRTVELHGVLLFQHAPRSMNSARRANPSCRHSSSQCLGQRVGH